MRHTKILSQKTFQKRPTFHGCICQTIVHLSNKVIAVARFFVIADYGGVRLLWGRGMLTLYAIFCCKLKNNTWIRIIICFS